MIKKNTVKKIIIIAVWLFSLLVIGFLYTSIENRRYTREAEETLLSETNTIARQIPSYLQNNLYSKICLEKMDYSKLNAMCLALSETEDIDEVQDLLDEFGKITGVTGLSVYNLDGEPVSTYGSDPLEGLDFQSVLLLADANLESVNDLISESLSYYYKILLSVAVLNKTESLTVRTIKDKPWVLGCSGIETEEEARISQYFDWRSIFANMKVGKTGSLLVVDNNFGSILSYGDKEDLPGKEVEVLDLRLEGVDHAATLEDLHEAFEKADQLVKVTLDGKETYATRLNIDDTMILALLPVPEIRVTVNNVMSILMLLLFLATGCCVLYTILHLDSSEESQIRFFGHFAWDKFLAGKILVITILTVLIVFVVGLFAESLLKNAEISRYCQDKVSDAVDLFNSHTKSMSYLEQWFQDEYQLRARIAKTVVDRKNPADLTSEYLQKLSDSLGVKSIYIFDNEGETITTNAPYTDAVISKDDPYYSLLQGREIYTSKSSFDEITGDYVQKAGIALTDKNGKLSGCLQLVGDINEVNEINKNLEIGKAFEQISLKNDTCVMAVVGASASDENQSDQSVSSDNMIVYTAQVTDGKYQLGLDQNDYYGARVESVGISPDRLIDNYSGSMTLLNESYFASVRKADEFFFLVMLPQIILSTDNFTQAMLITVLTLAILLLVLFIACIQMNHTSEEKAEEVEEKEKKENKEKTHEDVVKTALDEFLDRKKPDFEERWPDDCKRWRDKTANEKYLFCLKILLIVSLCVVITNAVLAGNNSIWFYIFTTSWNKGINLYSITYCLIDICFLFVFKILAHKILFLLAKAMDAKGETVCLLLDSFTGYALAVIGIFACLGNVGINATALSLSAGIASVIFSIGCQSIVADILAGILMIFEGTVSVGDFIFFNQKPEFVQGIGIRTTQLKFFGETTIVRNNEFKNYVQKPPEQTNLLSSTLSVDINESLERIEEILERELPVIQDRLNETIVGDVKGPKYRKVDRLSETGMDLYFATFCRGRDYLNVSRALNRELKLMCERNNIAIAVPKIEVKEGLHKDTDSKTDA